MIGIVLYNDPPLNKQGTPPEQGGERVEVDWSGELPRISRR
jgi:hypothetical protein